MKIRRILLAIFCLIILISVSTGQVYCPNYSEPKDGDVNKDNHSDWFIFRVVDNYGNDVEEWCIDPDGKENAGDETDPYDEYFAKLWSRIVDGVEEKYLVGWCPWEGGRNTETILNVTDEKGKVRFVGLIHRSEDGNKDDPGSLPGNDSREWVYNATSHNLTHKHYDRNGTEQPAETETKTPIKWNTTNATNESHQAYNELPPYSASFNWTGLAMVSYPVEYQDVTPLPPPVRQLTGIYDTSILNHVEQSCRNCHSAGVPNRHHNLVATGKYSCNNCHPTQTGPNGQYVLLDRDCMNCHNGTAFYANNIVNIARPHHINTTQAQQRNCNFCHGSYIANYNDGHYIPTYATSEVTPKTQYKVYNASSGRYWGGCYACHNPYDPPILDHDWWPPIWAQRDTHHLALLGNKTGIDHQRDTTSGSACNWCHTVNVTDIPLGYPNPLDFEFRNSSWQADPDNLTGCEQCHDVSTIHNIQYNYSMTQGKKGWGHIGDNWDCNGCHAFWDAGDVRGLEGAIIPDMTTVTPGKLISMQEAIITIKGNNFISGAGNYTSVVSVDGVRLTPISITDNEIVVTVPRLVEGTHTVQVVKTGDITDKLSKLASLVVVAPADIKYASITKRTKTEMTINGTSFGPRPDPLFESLGVWLTNKKGITVKAELIGWSDNNIVARVNNTNIGDTVTVKTLNGEDTAKIQP